MSPNVSELQSRLERLSPQQSEVANFVDALLSNDKPQPRQPMTFEWAGCLADLRDQYTSVELQKAGNRWREEMALGYLQQDENAPEHTQ